MRTLILLLAVLFIVTSCEMKKDTLTQENVEQTILAKEHQWLDRWAAGDPLGILEVCADDVTYFEDIGAETRVDGLEEMRNYITSLAGTYPPHSYEIVDPKVQVYGDIAICTLRYHATLNGEPISQWKATDVYRLTKGEWRLVHAHWSVK